MENFLRQIAANTAPKQCMSFAVNSTDTEFTTNFNPPLYLDADKEYEMALLNLETYNSFPNIDETNNTFKWSKDSGQTWYEIKIPTGSYEITRNQQDNP